MKISTQDSSELKFTCEALILPFTEDMKGRRYDDINKALGQSLKKILSSGEFSGKTNEVFLLHTHGKIKPERILLAGLGKTKEVTREALRQAGGSAAAHLANLKITDMALSTGLINSLKLRPTDFLEGCMLSQYCFEKYRKNDNRKSLTRFTILSSDNLKKDIKLTKAITNATYLSRDLVNTPANDMTPTILLRHARKLKNVSVKVIDRKQAEKLGMGAYLSVAKGSAEAPKFIVITYNKKNIDPVVLVGKSITFDSGGISLKPSKGMEKMKYDMAGGAAVLGVMKAVSEMKLPQHVIAILPATENLPGGKASKPGDVVRSITGKTIEILNTDAEGRLVLADALGYAKRFNPSAIIDIATLTGACAIALGDEAMAMMGTSEKVMDRLRAASEETGEKVWQMPLFDEYKNYIKSDIADLKNISGSTGGLVTSGCFLKEFAGDMPWAHLDIASTAWTDKDRPYIPKGATGIGMRLLLNFLISTK